MGNKDVTANGADSATHQTNIQNPMPSTQAVEGAHPMAGAPQPKASPIIGAPQKKNREDRE